MSKPGPVPPKLRTAPTLEESYRLYLDGQAADAARRKAQVEAGIITDPDQPTKGACGAAEPIGYAKARKARRKSS